MPTRVPDDRLTRSAARTSATSARGYGAAHVLGRALAVHALLAAGRTPGEVQRRLGESKSYAGMLSYFYFGRALAGLESEDLASPPHTAAPAIR